MDRNKNVGEHVVGFWREPVRYNWMFWRASRYPDLERGFKEVRWAVFGEPYSPPTDASAFQAVFCFLCPKNRVIKIFSLTITVQSLAVVDITFSGSSECKPPVNRTFISFKLDPSDLLVSFP